MSHISLVIFDLDGTLINAYPAIIRSFNHTMRAMGYPVLPPEKIIPAVGWGDKNLLKPFVSKTDFPKAMAVYRRHHAVALKKYSRLLPGAQKVLACLKKQGFALAVASNRPTKFARILLKHLGIRNLFDMVLCADTLAYGKPHPLIIHEIRKKLRAKPGQTMYVGDMAIDAQAGRRAGVRTVIVTTGSSSPSEVRREKPYKVIKSLFPLCDLVKE